MRVGEHGVLEADLVECAEDIGAELDAGADLAELGRLLQHPDRDAVAGERISRREPADAAAGDEDRFIFFVSLRHACFLAAPPVFRLPGESYAFLRCDDRRV